MTNELFNDPIDSVRKVPGAGFSRLFAELPPHQPEGDDPVAAQTRLARRLYDKDPTARSDVNVNARFPAAYSFLAQFVAHDLSFDPSLPGQSGGEGGAVANARSPRLDLDMVYGGDPDLNLEYYVVPKPRQNSYRFRFGDTDGVKQFDFHREGKVARIPDDRDDQHVIISQLHVALMRLHNEYLRRITSDPAQPDAKPRAATRADFFEARRRTRWHYQYVVIEDLLPRLLGERQCREVLEPCRARWRERQATMADAPTGPASIPLEFAVSVYRIGHSTIRSTYKVNNEAPALPLFGPPPAPDADDVSSLAANGELHPRLVVSWDRLLKVPGCEHRVQYARRFGPRLPFLFSMLPGLVQQGGLAYRDLERGRQLGLPSGQDVARRLGLPASQIEVGNDSLWYYVMKEVPDGGLCVGPVAARILCKTLLDVMYRDPGSYLSRQPDWKPTGVGASSNAFLHMLQVAKMPFAPPDEKEAVVSAR